MQDFVPALDATVKNPDFVNCSQNIDHQHPMESGTCPELVLP